MRRPAIAIAIGLAWLPAIAMAANYASVGNEGYRFVWSNASDMFGRFGQPVSDPDDTFVAFPDANFFASAAGGATDTTGDVLSIDVTWTQPVLIDINSVTLTIGGTYTIAGPNSGVVVDQAVLRIESPTYPYADERELVFSQTQIGNSVSWTETATITVPWYVPVTDATITVDHLVQAVSSTGSSSTISADFVRLDVYTPEPMTLALGLLGMLMVSRRGPARRARHAASSGPNLQAH